jgi:ferrous iron transport protein B
LRTIALVGNPNSGKTTIFNALTGTNQHVGNWPGVTVEKKEGKVKHGSEEYTIIDLPGTYGLGGYSEDEVVARDFILEGNYDVIINVVDATNLERNLYLTTLLMEMGAKVVIALNMVDEAEKRHIKIDYDRLSKEIGSPIVPTIASKGKGIHNLMQVVEKAIVNDNHNKRISYGKEIDEKIDLLKSWLEKQQIKKEYPLDWLAIKLLENDQELIKQYSQNEIANREIIDEIRTAIDEIVATSGMEPEMVILDKRYEFVSNVLKASVIKPKDDVETITDKIDRIVTHKHFGIPIFALIMFIIYQLTFTIGQDILGEWVAIGIGWLGELVSGFLEAIQAPEILILFISDGVFGGVGAVLEFVPIILVLYMMFGILEDTGYLSRAAYVMDRFMRALGLHGKTFISMLIGSGCNVPGIMATRTLESKKDRMIAILINPFISCGARLPIYMVFIAAFFPNHGGLVLFSLYALGTIVALTMGRIFSKTLFKGEESFFIMELPPYRIPTIKGIALYMWEQVASFINRAGTVIFSVVSLLWVLSILPYGVEPYSQASFLGRIGSFIAPIFKPAGFGTWQASVGLFAGIAAKEAVVATLGMVYAGVEEGTRLIASIQGVFTSLSAYSFMVMTLLYTPCAATIATIAKETNSKKWALFATFYTFIIGWLGAVIVYQVGRLFGLS